MFKLVWLGEVLRAASLKVIEKGDWKNRGHGDMQDIRGILCHHTGEAIDNNTDPVIDLLVKGRPDLSGPLSQLGLGQDGSYYLIAAGKASHAGKGAWKPMRLADNGNSHLIGIEAENNGIGERWPDVQMNAYARGCAAMIRHLKLPVEAVIAHKEYAPGRKSDPNFDMAAFRKQVASFL